MVLRTGLGGTSSSRFIHAYTGVFDGGAPSGANSSDNYSVSRNEYARQLCPVGLKPTPDDMLDHIRAVDVNRPTWWVEQSYHLSLTLAMIKGHLLLLNQMAHTPATK